MLRFVVSALLLCSMPSVTVKGSHSGVTLSLLQARYGHGADRLLQGLD